MARVFDIRDARRIARLLKSMRLNSIAEKVQSGLAGITADAGFFVNNRVKPYFIVYSPDEQAAEEAAYHAAALAYRDIDMLATLEGPSVEPVEVDGFFIFEDGRWRLVERRATAFKVVVPRPELVRVAREEVLARWPEVYATGFNVKYPVRVGWDLGVRYFGVEPIYGDSEREFQLISEKVMVFDIEVLKDNKVVMSSLVFDLMNDEIRADDVVVATGAPGDLTEIEEAFAEAWKSGVRIVYGHNILGFDIPMLVKLGLQEPRLAYMVPLDGVLILKTHGNSFQIGSSKSLYAVAKKLAGKAGITREELELKARSTTILQSGNMEEIIKYNVNDVVVTAKLARVILPFILNMSALLAIPPSVVAETPAGVLAEWFLYRYYEMRGILIGYKVSNANLSGSKVLLDCAIKAAASLDRFLLGKLGETLDPKCDAPLTRLYSWVYQFDVNAMYPSFVMHFKIDPACLKERSLPVAFYLDTPDFEEVKQYLDGNRGLCSKPAVVPVVEHLYKVRLKTKALKKKDKRYEQLDNATKATLNALAYGVLGKHGWAPLGNDAVAEAIFHGTRAAQYELFIKSYKHEELRKMGCTPVYSDTDSVFLACGRRLSQEEVERLQSILNEILEPYGLTLSFEGEWLAMYIHGKKNYILIGAEDVVVKGSYMHKKSELSLPPLAEELVSTMLREGKVPSDEDLRKLVEEAPLDDISVEMHNMLWRMVLVDPKESRAKHRLVVGTPWQDVPYGILARVSDSGWLHPRRVPLLAEAVRRGVQEIDFKEYDALTILDAKGYTSYDIMREATERICGANSAALVVDGVPYCVRLHKVEYKLEIDGDIYYVKPSQDLIRRLREALDPERGGRRRVREVRLLGIRFVYTKDEMTMADYRRLALMYIAGIVDEFRHLASLVRAFKNASS